MPLAPTGQMVLANRLTDGRVVFLAADGNWVDDITAGTVSADHDAAERLLAQAQRAGFGVAVVDPYLIDIRLKTGGRLPVSFREQIRAAGPTVRTDRVD